MSFAPAIQEIGYRRTQSVSPVLRYGAARMTASNELPIIATVVLSGLLHLAALAWLTDTLLLGREPHPNPAPAGITVNIDSRVAGAPHVPQPGTQASSPPAGSIPAGTPERGPSDPMMAVHEHAQTRAAAPSPFLPPNQVERAAYPLSAPNLRPLQLLVKAYSGTPIRLRLYVDVRGSVVDVKILHALPMDEEAATLLVQVWERVGFVPARRDGREVASYQDVEFQLADRSGGAVVRSGETLAEP